MASFEQMIKFESEKPHGVVRLVAANGFYRAYNHRGHSGQSILTLLTRLAESLPKWYNANA
jgi:hypothetical protein